MNFNFKEIGNSGNTSEALPTDRYIVEVESTEVKKATTGTMMIDATFVVKEGEFTGRKLWHNFSLTAKSMIYLYRFFEAAQSSVIEKEDIDETKIAAAMVGLKASVYAVAGKTNKGNPKNDLTNWTPVDGEDAPAETSAKVTKEKNMFKFDE